MANRTNQLINKLITEVKTVGVEEAEAQLKRIENDLLGIARRQTAEELGARSWRELSRAQQESADTLARVAQHMDELQKRMVSERDADKTVRSYSIESRIQSLRELVEVQRQAAQSNIDLAGSVRASAEALRIRDTLLGNGIKNSQYQQQVVQGLTQTLIALENVGASGKVIAYFKSLRDSIAAMDMEKANLSDFVDLYIELSQYQDKLLANPAWAKTGEALTPVLERLSKSIALMGLEKELLDKLGVSRAQETQLIQQNTEARKNEETIAQRVIQRYAQLSEVQRRSIQQWVQQGLALSEMIPLARQAGMGINQLKDALASMGYTVQSTNAAARQSGSHWAEMIRQMRGARYGALAVASALTMLTSSLGEGTPQMVREWNKALMMMSSFGMAATMLNVPASIGLITGAVISLGVAAIGTDEKTGALLKSLDEMAKKDDAINTLAQIASVGKEAAQAMYELAQNNAEAAAALRDFVRDTRDMNLLEAFLQGVGDGLAIAASKLEEFYKKSDLGPLLRSLSPLASFFDRVAAGYEQIRAYRSAEAKNTLILAEWKDNLKKAEEEYGKVIEKNTALEENRRRAEQDALKTKEREKSDLLMIEGPKKYAEAWKNYTQAVENADAALQQATRSANESYESAKRGLAFQMSQAAFKEADNRRKIEDSLQDSLYKSWREYNDRLFELDRTRAEKLADAEYDYNKAVEDNNRERVRAAYDLAYKLYTIERERIESLADLDFNTALDLSKAKTENEKFEIEWRAMHERALINQRAADAREDAINRKQMDDAEREQRIRDLQEELERKKFLIQRQYLDDVLDARRALENKRADAIDSYNDQLNDLRFALEQQNREFANQAQEIERDHSAALKAAQDRYVAETEAARERYQDELKEIEQFLIDKQKEIEDQYNLEMDKIRERYETERDEIEKTWQQWLNKHNLTMELLRAQFEAAMGIAGADLSRMTGTYLPGGQGLGFGFAGGTDMIVPPGYNHDTYPIRVSSGERVQVTPAQNAGPNAVSISVEPMLKPMIQELMNHLLKSGALREGVRIVLRDAVYQG